MKSLSLPQPHMIVVLGVPGSGKTFFAEQFAKTFHVPYVHYAKIVKLSNSSATAARKLAVYQVNELLKTKQSIILEGLSSARTDRTELAKIAQSAGYATLLVWVQTDPAAARQRSLKPLKGSVSPAISSTQFDAAVRQFSIPHASEPTVVISGKHTYASQAKVVLKKLTASHPELTSRRVAARPNQAVPARATDDTAAQPAPIVHPVDIPPTVRHNISIK